MSRPATRSPLPDDVSLPRRIADWQAAGVSRSELAGPMFTTVLRGERLWTPAVSDDPVQRIRAVVEVMPKDAALTGWAGLHWVGVRALDGRTGPGAAVELPVTVSVGPVGRMRRRRGLDIDRSTILSTDLMLHDGVLVTTPARSCLHIACTSGAEEGLVAADAALRVGKATKEDIDDAVSRLAGIRGVPQARLVAQLADGRAESGPESRFRYIWVVVAGLPPPEVNVTLTDLEGFFAARADLIDLDAGVAGEYDGADHRDVRRHTADNVRDEDVTGLNLGVVRATSIDLWPQRPRLVRRLLAAFERGRARDRSKDRWLRRT